MRPASHAPIATRNQFTHAPFRSAPQLRSIAILCFTAALWAGFVLATSGAWPLRTSPDGTASSAAVAQADAAPRER
jgi:hypothetical protein